MTSLETDAALTNEMARLKAVASQWNARSNWMLARSFVAAALVGLATWFLQDRRDRDDIHAGLALGLAGATFLFGALVARIRFLRPDIKCPQCGYDWDMCPEGKHDWMTWEYCPGCGLKMCDEVGRGE